MTAPPVWVTVDHAIAINEALLEGTPENHFVRDLSALEAGIHRAQHQFHLAKVASLPVLATHLIYGVGKAHAFEQGNKRTAWACGRYFLSLNGYTLQYHALKPIRIAQQKMIAAKIESLMTDDEAFQSLSDNIARLMVRTS